MKRRPSQTFVVPSESFWARVRDTPFVDLLRGRVTGAKNPRRLIAAADLPNPIAAGVQQVVANLESNRSTRREQTLQLIEWARRQLSKGRPVDELAQELTLRRRLARYHPQRAVGETYEIAVQWLARQSQTQIGPDAGRLAGSQCD